MAIFAFSILSLMGAEICKDMDEKDLDFLEAKYDIKKTYFSLFYLVFSCM